MGFYEEQVNYQWIKQVAKAQGVSVNELIVLAPQNDPFYAGTPNDVALGEWFSQVWNRSRRISCSRDGCKRGGACMDRNSRGSSWYLVALFVTILVDMVSILHLLVHWPF